MHFNTNLLLQRMIRAAKLDTGLYEEVEKDTQALPQAMLVVIVSAVSAGIGVVSKIGAAGIFIGAIAGLISWYVWAMLTYVIGTRFLPEPNTKADLGELLRTIGFASSPGIIRILGIMPGFQRLIFSLAAAWMLVAMVVAVKCALDYKNIWRAAIVCFIGWIIQILLISVIYAAFGGMELTGVGV